MQDGPGDSAKPGRRRQRKSKPSDPVNPPPAYKLVGRRRRRREAPAKDVGILELVWTPSGNISLKRLHPKLQSVVQWSFIVMEGQLVGHTAYPDLQPNLKIEFLAEVLRMGAESARAPQEIQDALRDDGEFIHQLMSLVSHSECVV